MSFLLVVVGFGQPWLARHLVKGIFIIQKSMFRTNSWRVLSGLTGEVFDQP